MSCWTEIRHLKYVWFTKFTKFWGEVKNGNSLGYPKTKKLSTSGGFARPLVPYQGLCPWTPLGAPLRPPCVPPAPNLLYSTPLPLANQSRPINYDIRYLNIEDRRTDIQTTCRSNAALYVSNWNFPTYFRSQARKYHRWNTRSLELSLRGTVAPASIAFLFSPGLPSRILNQ